MFRALPPKSVTDISDNELWSAFKVPAPNSKAPGAQHLRSAISHGLAGRKAKAYAALADYHRISLADEWAHQLSLVEPNAAPSSKALRNTLNYKINCWHKEVFQFDKDNIDWHPKRLSSVNGFHYFGFFMPVVSAYVKTGEKKYEDFILNIITQYKTYQKGKNWTDAYKWHVFNQLGSSSKFSSWLPAYLALIHNGSLTTAAAESFIKHFLGFARAMKLGNKKFIAHNIATHGCRCMMTIGRLFPEFAEAKSWDTLGSKRMYEQAVHGFYADGGHDERVWGYGSYTLHSVSEAYLLAQRYGGLGKYDKPMLKCIRNAYRFYAKTLGPAPHYRQPVYGDSGWGSQKDVLERGQQFMPKGADVTLGVDRTKSYNLKDSKFIIMRNGDDDDSTHMSLNYGQYAGWHSHQDLLHMSFWSKGQVLLEEMGRFGPYQAPLDVRFREAQSHNLLTVDGMLYNCRENPAADVRWFSNESIDYFSATHWAYEYFVFGRDRKDGTSPNMEVKVRRTVLFVKDPGYAIVLDSTLHRLPDRPTMNAITQNWHARYPFVDHKPGQVLVKADDKAGCVMAYARPEGLARLDKACDFTEQEGSRWGTSYDSHHLMARRWMDIDYRGTVGFATLIYPYKGKAPAVSIKALPTDESNMWRAEAYEVQTPAGKDVVILNPERLDMKYRGKAVPHRAVVKLAKGRGEVTVP